MFVCTSRLLLGVLLRVRELIEVAACCCVFVTPCGGVSQPVLLGVLLRVRELIYFNKIGPSLASESRLFKLFRVDLTS